eukprot:jgi/Picsp_1/2324/NSC_05787-R1_protein
MSKVLQQEGSRLSDQTLASERKGDLDKMGGWRQPDEVSGGRESHPVLVTTVDIGPGMSVQLEVYEGDDPGAVAEAFCKEHGLPESVVQPLTSHIVENMEDIVDFESLVGSESVKDMDQGDWRDMGGEEGPVVSMTERQRGPSLMAEAAETAAEITTALANLGHLRPTSANSSLGSEYFGRAELPVSMHRSAEAEAATVADRLYADHFRKEVMLAEKRRIHDLENQLRMKQVHCTPASRMLAAHRTAEGYASYGERLYEEGRQDAARKERLQEIMKKQQELLELKEATFHPQITKMAQNIGHGGSGMNPAWMRLHHKGAGITARREAREASIRRELEEEEMRECSFKPQIAKMSEKIMERRRGAAMGSISSHDRLHFQGRHDKNSWTGRRKQLETEDSTFKPEINKSSVQKANKMNMGGPKDVADRLLIRGQVYEERLHQAQEDMLKPIDPKTGRRLFHPKTYRGPNVPRDLQTNIGDHLYKAALESAERAQKQANQIREAVQRDASTAHVNAVSERMMERLKMERIKAIYAYLGHTPSDYFAPESIDIIDVVSDSEFMETIDPEVRADVEHAARLAMRRHALLDEEDSKENNDASPSAAALSQISASSSSIEGHPAIYVTEDFFVKLMNEVIRRTRGFTRNYLLPMPGTRKKWEEPTFKPKLDQKSLKMATKLRPENIPSHEILYNTATQTAEKLTTMKQEIEAMELQKCTFKPHFETEHRPTRGKALALVQHADSCYPSKHSFVRIADLQEDSALTIPGGKEEYTSDCSRDNDKETEDSRKDETETRSVTRSANAALYDGIDAIEQEIREAMAQLSKNTRRSIPRKDALDTTASIDYDALFSSSHGQASDLIPSSSS